MDTLSLTMRDGRAKTADYVGINLSIPSIGSNGTKDAVSCVVMSEETGTPEVTIIAAFYDIDNKMLTTWTGRDTLEDGKKLTLTGTLPIEYQTVKIFLLSKDGYMPLCEASSSSIDG